MDDADRKKLQNNFTSLVEQTNIDLLLPLLYEKGVFSNAMMEPYRDTTQPAKKRKRELYRHIERRGPHAFQKLIDALMETGHFDLVRCLDPGNTIIRLRRPIERRPEGEQFISLKGERNDERQSVPQVPGTSNPFPRQPEVEPAESDFEVVKSTSFKDKDGDKNIPCYITRKKQRGACLMITNIEFTNDIEEYRHGAQIDQRNLQKLFTQIGFPRIICYNNLNYNEMTNIITEFAKLPVLSELECLFVIVASHGYERGIDTDICCTDGGLIQKSFIIKQFNDDNCPQMRGKPKVFIFQSCRGDDYNHSQVASNSEPQLNLSAMDIRTDGKTWDQSKTPRIYSDILIANSTIPGFVAHRDPNKGSWYIQSLCKVFAERAFDCHIEKLLTLVDMDLEASFKQQTSSVERWGFNKRLYLHPGLFED